MKRAVIEVAPSTRDAVNAARPEMYIDAGQVLNADGRILFLLGVWMRVRHTEAGAEACEVTARNLAAAGIGRDARCHA